MLFDPGTCPSAWMQDVCAKSGDNVAFDSRESSTGSLMAREHLEGAAQGFGGVGRSTAVLKLAILASKSLN